MNRWDEMIRKLESEEAQRFLAALYGSDAVAQEVLVFTVRGRTMDLERNKP